MEKANVNRIGSKCYIVCTDKKANKPVIDNLQLDFDELKKNGS